MLSMVLWIILAAIFKGEGSFFMITFLEYYFMISFRVFRFIQVNYFDFPNIMEIFGIGYVSGIVL